MILGQLLPVGSVIHSMLTEAQFQAQAGLGWVLADGRSAAGSVYNTITGAGTIPDMTGRFLRGKGANNPDGSLALGAYSADKLVSHNHNLLTATGGGSGSLDVVATGGATASTIYTTNNTEPKAWIQARGDNETAPKSITVNIFMRIN